MTKPESPDWAELDEKDRRRRKRAMRQAARELLAVLANPRGLERLRAITDEEWEAAVQAKEALPDAS